MSALGLTAEVMKGRGEDAHLEKVWVCAPFEVLGRVRDPLGEGWARHLRWQDPDGRVHEHAVSDRALHGDVGILAADLAERGLRIAVVRTAKSQLAEYLNGVEVRQRITTVTRTGWHRVGETKVFVLPDETIGSPADEIVILAGSPASPYASRGTLEDWQNSIGRLTAGHSRLVLAVSTALAGPLLDLIGGEGGGLNLFGQSSKGKTTALRVAASVWGRGGADPGFVRSWRATANAQESTAAIVTDTLLCLDEIGVAEGRDAAMAVYQLASGVGKGRSARDGSIRTPMTWRVLTLSTGEMPLAAKISEDRNRRAFAGQAVRLIDVAADAGQGFGLFDGPGPEDDPALLAERLAKAAASTYGTLGPAFVRALANAGLEQARQIIADLVKEFVADNVPAGADGQVRRVATRLGLIAAAGEFATSFHLVPWAEGESEDAAARILSEWIATRGGGEAAEIGQSIAQVRKFFEAYGDARFESVDDPETRIAHTRAGWRRGFEDRRTWLVLPEVWRTEICTGLDPVATARILADRGMLKPDGCGKLQRSERTPGGRTLRVYVVNASILDGGANAT